MKNGGPVTAPLGKLLDHEKALLHDAHDPRVAHQVPVVLDEDLVGNNAAEIIYPVKAVEVAQGGEVAPVVEGDASTGVTYISC